MDFTPDAPPDATLDLGPTQKSPTLEILDS